MLYSLPIESLATVVWSSNKSVIQVETLDHYGVPDDDRLFSLYLNGQQPTDLDLGGYKAWFAQVKAAVDRGVDVVRVHIVPETLTPYLRFEIEIAYLGHCVPAGEKVLLIQREACPRLASQVSRDFYLLDDQRLIYPEYDSQNKFVGLSEDLAAESLQAHLKLKRELVTEGIPLDTFVHRMRSATLRVALTEATPS